MNEQDLEALSNVDIFRDLDAEKLNEAAAFIHFRSYEAQREIFAHQDTSREVFFVLDGNVRVTIFSKSGKEITFRDVGPGGSFGELSAIDGGTRSAGIVTLSPARVGSMAPDQFVEFVSTTPVVARAVMCKLTYLVRSLSDRVYEFSTPVPTRVCIEILRMARDNMINPTTARIKPAPKHAEIASRINTHREAVSRVMSDLQKRHILRRGSGELLVLDVDKLNDEIEGNGSD